MASARTVARALFAVLVLATFGAFFVAQRVKQGPPLLKRVAVTPRFSPNGDGVKDRARVSFRLEDPDVVDVEILDADGEVVRTLGRELALRAGPAHRFFWNGRDADGRRVTDGRYRLRVVLREQGRSVTSPRASVVDTVAPRPSIRVRRPFVISPDGDGRDDVAVARYRGPDGTGGSRLPRFGVYRTAPGELRRVTGFRGRRGVSRIRWDGTIDGRPAPPGNYLLTVAARDAAGNQGTSPPVLPPRRQDRSGRSGVRVTYLEARAPAVPVAANAAVAFTVRTPLPRYRWSIRRLNSSRAVRRGVSDARGGRPLRPRAPARAGVYILELRSGRHRYQTPFVVRAPRPARLLVVLPWLEWQATNDLDRDGDGWGELLAVDGQVRRSRAFAPPGLPVGLAARQAPILRQVRRAARSVDYTTDLALAEGLGPRLADAEGVLFVGRAGWYPDAAGRRLAQRVRSGARIGWVGLDSFHRHVRITEQLLRADRNRRERDAFGERTTLTTAPSAPLEVGRDQLGLFSEVVPSFGSFRRLERTLDLPGGAELRAGAGPPEGGLVTPAYRLGRGLVVRLNPRGLGEQVADDPAVRRLVRRLVRLLAG